MHPTVPQRNPRQEPLARPPSPADGPRKYNVGLGAARHSYRLLATGGHRPGPARPRASTPFRTPPARPHYAPPESLFYHLSCSSTPPSGHGAGRLLRAAFRHVVVRQHPRVAMLRQAREPPRPGSLARPSTAPADAAPQHKRLGRGWSGLVGDRCPPSRKPPAPLFLVWGADRAPLTGGRDVSGDRPAIWKLIDRGAPPTTGPARRSGRPHDSGAPRCYDRIRGRSFRGASQRPRPSR